MGKQWDPVKPSDLTGVTGESIRSNMGQTVPPIVVRRGRPPGRFYPNADWALAELLYVEGELEGDGELARRVYPTVAVIATKAQTSEMNVHARAKRYDWKSKRDTFRRERIALAQYVSNGDTRGAEAAPIASSPNISRRDAEAVLKDFIHEWDRNLHAGKIQIGTIADLDKAVRLLAFVRGEADSRKEQKHTFSLDNLQQTHARTLVRVSVPDEVAGVLHAGTPAREDEPETITVEAEEPAREEPVPALSSAWDEAYAVAMHLAPHDEHRDESEAIDPWDAALGASVYADAVAETVQKRSLEAKERRETRTKENAKAAKSRT